MYHNLSDLRSMRTGNDSVLEYFHTTQGICDVCARHFLEGRNIYFPAAGD